MSDYGTSSLTLEEQVKPWLTVSKKMVVVGVIVVNVGSHSLCGYIQLLSMCFVLIVFNVVEEGESFLKLLMCHYFSNMDVKDVDLLIEFIFFLSSNP